MVRRDISQVMADNQPFSLWPQMTPMPLPNANGRTDNGDGWMKWKCVDRRRVDRLGGCCGGDGAIVVCVFSKVEVEAEGDEGEYADKWLFPRYSDTVHILERRDFHGDRAITQNLLDRYHGNTCSRGSSLVHPFIVTFHRNYTNSHKFH